MKLKNREKILFVFATIAVAILLFDRLYYFQRSRRIFALREEIKSIETQLNELDLYSKGLEDVQREVERLERELKSLNEKILRGEEFRTFLKHLARESDPSQMRIISITPIEEDRSSREDKKEEPPLPYRKVNVKMVFQSTYHKLGIYLKGIEELPFMIRLHSLQVERREEESNFLNVKMSLSLMVTQKEKE
ncbi:MAG: type 4a pilus biogenesis protein PilO [Thermodesulfobacteriota bacterium]